MIIKSRRGQVFRVVVFDDTPEQVSAPQPTAVIVSRKLRAGMAIARGQFALAGKILKEERS